MHVLPALATALLALVSIVAVVSSSPAPSAAPGAAADGLASTDVPQTLSWELVSRRPHDIEAWTQGLLLDGQGRLFESTGSTGPAGSTLREVDPLSGEVLRQRTPPTDEYSEGLALVGDELVQITWTDNVARRYDVETFELTGRHRYKGEGWGLCYDEERLVMSNGTDRLVFRDPQTFKVIGDARVTLAGESLSRLNELECVGDAVWSNVLGSDAIMRIDPADGVVTGVLDGQGLRELLGDESSAGSLNGIAYDSAAHTYLVTGKLWPELFEIRLLDADDE